MDLLSQITEGKKLRSHTGQVSFQKNVEEEPTDLLSQIAAGKKLKKVDRKAIEEERERRRKEAEEAEKDQANAYLVKTGGRLAYRALIAGSDDSDADSDDTGWSSSSD